MPPDPLPLSPSPSWPPRHLQVTCPSCTRCGTSTPTPTRRSSGQAVLSIPLQLVVIATLHRLLTLSSPLCRYSSLTAHFVALYGSAPAFYARAPGRVNLIGEHVDYRYTAAIHPSSHCARGLRLHSLDSRPHLFPAATVVLPMAIDRDTVIAASVDPSASASTSVRLANYDQAYPAKTFEDSQRLFTIADSHDWSKYVQCGFKGVFNEAKAAGDSSVLPPSSSPSSALCCLLPTTSHAFRHHSLQLLVSGNVPSIRWLCLLPPPSSASPRSPLRTRTTSTSASPARSSPTSHRAASATSARWAAAWTRPSLSSLSAALRSASTSTRRSPTRPCSCHPDAVFVVCNSLFESEKAVQAAKQFNARVLECKLAALLLAKRLGLAVRETEIAQLTLRKVQQLSQTSTAQMAARLEQSKLLHVAPYSVAEVEKELGLSLSTSLAYNPNFAKVGASHSHSDCPSSVQRSTSDRRPFSPFLAGAGLSSSPSSVQPRPARVLRSSACVRLSSRVLLPHSQRPITRPSDGPVPRLLPRPVRLLLR